MASIGQAAADHMNGISRLASMHPGAFYNTWGAEHRDQYIMEMQDTSSYHGRSSSINRNGYQQPSPMESALSVWQQRQGSDAEVMLPHHRILPADNNISSSSMRGVVGGGSSRIPVGAILGSSESMVTRGSPQTSSAELYDGNNSTSVVTGDWQPFVDSDASRYSSLLPHTTASSSGLQQQSSSNVLGVAKEGAMIRKLIGKLGGSSSMGSSSSLSPSPSLSQQRVGGVEGLAASPQLGGGVSGNHCWTSAANATAVEIPTNVGGGGHTVDPTKGGLSLNHGGVVAAGLATSHCLSPFSADPGFAERAARFSSFSNNRNYAHPFSSDSESGGLARTRSRSLSGASPLSPRTSSSPPLLQESVGRVIGNDSAASEKLPDSRIREIQSCSRGVSVDRVPSAAAGLSKDDESSLEQNYATVEGNPASKTLSRTLSNGLGSPSNGENGREELLSGSATTSADTSSERMQADSTGPGETCPSPGGRSGATDVSIKKRKTIFEERAPSKHVGSGSASPHHDRDAKTAETEDAKAKRLRRGDGKDDMRGKADRSCSETSGESSPRPTKDHVKLSSEQPKTDYIHVRARRGQATDSHSLAERVRREKISERMKFLQDLVPGCSKVTGKAVMLDEIINYVQSLQRQVEFLSMKLASVNPRLDFHRDSFLGKEGPHAGSQAMVLGAETSITYPPLQPQLPRTQLQQGLEYQLHAEAAVRRSMSAVPVSPAPIRRVDGFEDTVRQTMWDDGELNSIVQMGFGNPQAMSSQGLQCHLPPGQVKVELQQSPITCL